jgi:hypothetical protein
MPKSPDTKQPPKKPAGTQRNIFYVTGPVNLTATPVITRKKIIDELLKLGVVQAADMEDAPKLDAWKHQLEETNAQIQQLQRDLHEYLLIQSLGLDLDRVKIRRYFPVRIYASHLLPRGQQVVTAGLESVAQMTGFEVVDEYLAEVGSWFQRFTWRSKELLNQPEVVERLQKIERAVELATLHQPQANIDKTESEAIAGLIVALNGTPKLLCRSVLSCL